MVTMVLGLSRGMIEMPALLLAFSCGLYGDMAVARLIIKFAISMSVQEQVNTKRNWRPLEASSRTQVEPKCSQWHSNEAQMEPSESQMWPKCGPNRHLLEPNEVQWSPGGAQWRSGGDQADSANTKRIQIGPKWDLSDAQWGPD